MVVVPRSEMVAAVPETTVTTRTKFPVTTALTSDDPSNIPVALNVVRARTLFTALPFTIMPVVPSRLIPTDATPEMPPVFATLFALIDNSVAVLPGT